MFRSQLLCTAFICLTTWGIAPVISPAADRMNVLFIATDDLRCDLACYGHPQVQTPQLDRLAKRGMLFERAYCQQALCNPSRASLMTGLRPDTLQLWNLTKHFRDQLPDVVTLPQHFKQQGYFTQNIGKIYHNWRTEQQGDPASWSVPAKLHFASHGDDKPVVNGKLPPNLALDPKCECRDVADDAYYDGRVASLAVEALQQRKAENEPFLLAVGFWKPHSPFNAPKRYWDLYSREVIALPEHDQWPTNAPRIAWHNSREALGEPARNLTTQQIQEIRHGYLANISYVDAQIGKVLDELDRQQLTDNTVIVFWSDHGYHLGEQSLWAKTSNFELDAHVPLIIATPRMKTAGTRTQSLVELVDLYPTLVDLCHLPTREDLAGKSLTPVLNDPQAIVKPAAFTQHPRPAYYNGMMNMEAMGYSLRSDRFRYTEWREPQTLKLLARELYDHEHDPQETANVAEQDQFAKTLIDLAKELQSQLPGPVKSSP